MLLQRETLYTGVWLMLIASFHLAATRENETNFCRAWASWNEETSVCQCAPYNYYVPECCGGYTSIDYLACATYNVESQATLVGECPFNAQVVNTSRRASTNASVENINLTSFMCDPLNRTGVLCSHCKPGLGPALLNYSYPCLECISYGWVAYFAATLVPSTIFFLVIVAFQIDGTSPSLSYIILHSHLLAMYLHLIPDVLQSTKHSKSSQFLLAALSYYSMWNLDFLRPILPSFCVSSDMSMLTVLALEYVVAVYPLFFTALVYTLIELHARGCRVLNVLWKPFHPVFYRFRKYCDIRGSVINAFATFVCLSYSKILTASVNMVSFTVIYSSSPSNFSDSIVLYFNASIGYSDASNLPYFILGLIMPFIFCILPLVTLLVFHTRLCKCLHKYRLLYEVVKVFQKHFKDGSDGTSDLRSFSGLYFAFQILYASSLMVRASFNEKWFLCFTTVLLIAYLHPYKRRLYNLLDTFWFAQFTAMVIALEYEVTGGRNRLNIFVFIMGLVLPILYANLVLLWYVVRRVKTIACCEHCLQMTYHCLFVKYQPADVQNLLPDRLENSAEYRPLLHP